jgi:UPF0755 protein
MSKRSFRLALATVAVVVLALGTGLVVAGREALRYPERRHGGSGQVVTIEITRGMKFPEVARTLAQKGVVDRPTWFRLYAMHKGLANKVRAGKYQIADNLAPKDVLAILVKGVEELEAQVTLPEGLHLGEVCALIAASGIADAAALEAVARDPAWLADQGIAGDTAEGYLFPDTYRFKVPTPPRKVLEVLVRRHREVYAELAKTHDGRLAKVKKDLDWTDREIVVMASIVEKETGAPPERRMVASVFYNRLLRKEFPSHRLETDPTIRYGCTIPPTKSPGCVGWDIGDRLHRAQLDDDKNLYNTYRHPGLPPGPISNPGRASLAAAMDPDRTDYFYFVAKDEKTHVFSKTYEEHRRWVEKYQQ